MLVDQVKRTVSGSKSRLGFSVPPTGGAFGVWNRFLTIDGQRIIDTGCVCDTCPCYFKRLPGNTEVNLRASDRLVEMLQSPVGKLDEELLDHIEKILPDGDYAALLFTVRPQLVQPGDANDYFSHENSDQWQSHKHDPLTAYYRLNTTRRYEFGCEKLFIECMVPLVHLDQLDRERVDFYQTKMRNGDSPTVLALSLLEGKMSNDAPDPQPDEDVEEHEFFTHYILDGHHKACAAALSGRPISLVSYLRLDSLFQEVNDDQLAFLGQAHLPPVYDQWLTTANDPDASDEEVVAALKSLKPYVELEKTLEALLRLAQSEETSPAVIHLAGLLLALRLSGPLMHHRQDQVLSSVLPQVRQQIEGFRMASGKIDGFWVDEEI